MDAATVAALETHRLRERELNREIALRAAHAERGLVAARDSRRSWSLLALRPKAARPAPAAAPAASAAVSAAPAASATPVAPVAPVASGAECPPALVHA